MRKITLRFKEADRGIYQAIVDGEKTVETRAATKRYQSIEAGDLIIAVCGKDRFEIPIKKVNHFDSLEQLFNVYKITSVLPAASSLEEAKNAFYSFSGYKEKIETYGIIAMELG